MNDAHGNDPLSALAVLDADELAVRPLAGITDRAAQLRRARRARTTVLGAAASVALVASLALLLPGAGTATSTPATATPGPEAATATATPCSRGSAVFDVGAHPELVHLLGGAGAPSLSSVYGVDLSGGPCSGAGTPTAAAIRARFSADGGTVTAGIVVSGPLAENPWSITDWVYETPGFTPAVEQTSASPEPGGIIRETVSVHGARGVLYRWPADSRTLVTVGTAGVQWQEPSTGQWWGVQSAGLSRAELLAVAEGLRITGDRLDEATVPSDGWTTLPVVDTGPPGHRFEANYDTDGDPKTLSVSDVPQYGPDLVGLVSPGAVKVADVDGARAFLRPIGIDGDSPSLQWAKDGLWFTLSAGPGTTFEELVALARSVEHVPADDPRITRAVATAAPNPYTATPTPGGATSESTTGPAPTATDATTTPAGDVTTQPVTPTDPGTVTSSPAASPTGG